MKTTILTLLALLSFCSSFSQEVIENNTKFIEVTGSSEMEVEPDEVRFQIGIQEYWKEEFMKNMEYKDYVTKIPLEEIEKSLLQELNDIGITQDQIIIKEVGNYWNSIGKGFKKSKTIEIIITDFSQINDLNLNIKTRGVNKMRISELKNKDITSFRKQVKIEAMKAAKEKATYLLESVEESIGGIISVIEIDNNNGSFWRPQNTLSNAILPSSTNQDSSNDNLRKIKLKYEIKVRFEIK